MKLIVREVPQDSVWLDPQTERLEGVNREPSHPGEALSELVRIIVILEIGIRCKECLMLTVEEIMIW